MIKLINYFKNIFKKKVSPGRDKIKEWSEEILSKNVFKYFTPKYSSDGVFLELTDRVGLREYQAGKRQKEFDNTSNSFQRESNVRKGSLSEIISNGMDEAFSYISNIPDVLKKYDSFNFNFSSKNSGAKKIYSKRRSLNFCYE